MEYAKRFIEHWVTWKVGGSQSLGGVSGDVLNDLVAVEHRLNANHMGIPSYGEPRSLEKLVRQVTSLNNSVDVGVPACCLRNPLHFEERHSTRNTILPECCSEQTTKRVLKFKHRVRKTEILST